jgi:hypothetical protein
MIARHLGDLPDAQKAAVAVKLRDLLGAWLPENRSVRAAG